MPIGYLDVPAGADLATKRTLVSALYEAMHEVYPFPDDTRIFLREWPLDSVSQNGVLGSRPVRPVLVVHVPQGGDPAAKSRMVRRIDEAVDDAYGGLPDFAVFFHEHSLDTVALHGAVLADDQRRVDEQSAAYGR